MMNIEQRKLIKRMYKKAMRYDALMIEADCELLDSSAETDRFRSHTQKVGGLVSVAVILKDKS